MSKFSTANARDQFSDMINRAAYGKERVILTRRGKEVAALIPLEDLSLLEELEDYIDAEEAGKAWKEQGNKKPVPWKEVKKRLGLK